MVFRKLEIYQVAYELFLKTHRTSFKLPKYELYELGSQLRRSSESVVANIVEGYGRNRYKQEYIRFLVFSHSSNNETFLHLEEIIDLYPKTSEPFKELQTQYDILGARINKYIQYVEKNWNDFK
ncbi:MAG: four helix bundle protein [Bacteroidia bacterium]|nr:four helix bundle protein [Bacteroidia bacterium]